MDYKLEEVHDKIYLLSFDDPYNLAMHFCRVQEFYENPTWRNKSFSLIEFMEWYAKDRGTGAFTYPTDWGGFNVPGNVMHNLYSFRKSQKIPDYNEYDELMANITDWLSEENGGTNWYLIGTKTDAASSMLKHEIAHGLWATNKKYKAEMQDLVNNLSLRQYLALEQWLKSDMYCDEVIWDEIHAYLSTGLGSEMEKSFKKKRITLKRATKKFTEVFDEYYETPV